MQPLPPLAWSAPTTIDEVVAALAEGVPGEVRLHAGGTDLVPNLKRGVTSARRLIGLGRVAELQELVDGPADALGVGAAVTLDDLGRDPRVVARWPAVAEAARQVASPQLRRMATLGGNLCLDTRCRFYDQSAFWRGALGGCLKADGDACHVVPTGRKCVAACCADTPAPLIAAGAELELASVRGPRRVHVADFFAGDGARNHTLAPDELLVRVWLPAPAPGTRAGYQRLRRRGAIDFPLLTVAATVVVERDVVRAVTVVVGALGAVPRRLRGLDALAVGRPLDAAVRAAIAAAATRQCHPLDNLGDAAWRQAVVAPLVRRTLEALEPATAPDAASLR